MARATPNGSECERAEALRGNNVFHPFDHRIDRLDREVRIDPG